MTYDDIARKLDEIEAELRKHGIAVPGNTEPQAVSGAFGGGDMAFAQWLATVFLPAARNALAAQDLPERSQVGVAAMRNFDGYPDMDELVSLLSQFDHAVETVASAARRSG